MPLNKRTKLSLKMRKRRSDHDEEKLIIVDMPDNSGVADLTGAAGVSECDGVPPVGQPSYDQQPALHHHFHSHGGQQVNSSYVKESSTDDPPGVTDSEDMESDNEDEEMVSNTSTQIKTEKESVS